jgi:TRAP-type C4-dicarboxylate transport system permease small subunit
VSEGSLPRAAARAEGLLHQLEDGVLALLIGALVGLASLQIALRALFDTGLVWIDPTLRVLVLWLGLLGAMAASRDGRHISVDALSRLLPERLRAGAAVVTCAFAAGICGLVAWHALRFVRSEMEYGTAAFSGVPAWALEAILPYAFAVIALRYLKRTWQEGRRALRPAPEEAGGQQAGGPP